MTPDAIESEIRQAFAAVERPYLRWREAKDDFDRAAIDQAIRIYWSARTR